MKYKKTKIGKIPADWGVKQLKDLAGSDKLDFIDGDWVETPYITSKGIRLIQTGNIGIGNFKDTTKRYVSEKSFFELKCKEVFPNDLLICRLADPIGRSCIVPDIGERFITAVDCTIVRPNKEYIDDRYLNHYLNSQPTLNLMKRMGGGVAHQRISRKNLGKIPVPLPTIPEQHKIAEILSTVDADIEKTDAIIKETQQLKKGLMEKLFTEGIGHTRFKKTKIGRIPEEWAIIKGFEITKKITKGASPRWQGYEYQNSGMLFITSENVRDGFLDISNPKFLPIEFHNRLKGSQLVKGDILINIVGASIGRACAFNGEYKKANINQAVCLFRVNNEIEANFILYYLQLPKTIKRLLGTQAGSARANLSLTDMKTFSFVLPSQTEQRKIVATLKGIDSKIENERATKSELEQLKKGLLQVLLTGKVRVKV